MWLVTSLLPAGIYERETTIYSLRGLTVQLTENTNTYAMLVKFYLSFVYSALAKCAVKKDVLFISVTFDR